MTAKTVELGKVVASDRATLQDVLARPGTRVVLLAGSEDPNAKMTLVLIDGYGPSFVVKVPTTSTAASVVRREGQSLEALARLPLGSLAPTIPRRVGTMPYENWPALVSTALPGSPMTVAYHGWHHTRRRRHVRRDFYAAGTWLGELHARTAGVHQPVTLVTDALERLGERFPRHPDLAGARRALAEPAHRLGQHMTPRTVVHGDYWCGNLLVRRHRVVGVVDWESCEMSGEPLRDVARFAVSYALYLDRHTRPGRRVAGHKGLRAGPWGSGVAYALSGAGWFSAILQNYLTVAMGRLGLPGYLWRDVLLGGIADVAASADHPEFAASHLGLLACHAPKRSGVSYLPPPLTARALIPRETRAADEPVEASVHDETTELPTEATPEAIK